MAIFGVGLPFILSWYVGKFIAERLTRWWGSIIAWIISIIGGLCSPIAYGILSDYSSTIEFDGMFFVKLFVNALMVSAFFGGYSIWRVRKKMRSQNV